MEEDVCASCKFKLSDENFSTVFESRGEFWGAPCSEEICTGYECPNCGHTEQY